MRTPSCTVGAAAFSFTLPANFWWIHCPQESHIFRPAAHGDIWKRIGSEPGEWGVATGSRTHVSPVRLGSPVARDAGPHSQSRRHLISKRQVGHLRPNF